MLQTGNSSRLCGFGIVLALGTLLSGATAIQAQAPVKTNLKKILVLDKSQGGANGHMESRRDLNAALAQLAVEKGFTITTIGQNTAAAVISAEFSPENLTAYQAVLFSNNDGVHAQLDAASKANFEAYVRNGGGFVPIHAASAFIANWPWITSVLVESFYGPAGSNQPKFNMLHDAEGMADGAEAKGIFKGLTPPIAFLDECYSFKSNPRGRPGVTILLTADEKTFSKPISGPMGDDHPVAWTKTEGKGRVAHISQGHSWSTNNVYASNNAYLKYFLYGAMRYVAGDFLGCTDNRYMGFNPDATKNNPTDCGDLNPVSLQEKGGGDVPGVVFQGHGGSALSLQVREQGRHEIRMTDTHGRLVRKVIGSGSKSYSLVLPSRSGIYFIEAKSGGRVTRRRVTTL